MYQHNAGNMAPNIRPIVNIAVSILLVKTNAIKKQIEIKQVWMIKNYFVKILNQANIIIANINSATVIYK